MNLCLSRDQYIYEEETENGRLEQRQIIFGIVALVFFLTSDDFLLAKKRSRSGRVCALWNELMSSSYFIINHRFIFHGVTIGRKPENP